MNEPYVPTEMGFPAPEKINDMRQVAFPTFPDFRLTQDPLTMNLQLPELEISAHDHG